MTEYDVRDYPDLEKVRVVILLNPEFEQYRGTSRFNSLVPYYVQEFIGREGTLVMIDEFRGQVHIELDVPTDTFGPFARCIYPRGKDHLLYKVISGNPAILLWQLKFMTGEWNTAKRGITLSKNGSPLQWEELSERYSQKYKIAYPDT